MCLNKWPVLSSIPPGDSCTFLILPVGINTQKVQIYCSQGTQAGKYIAVTANQDVISGSTSDGDTVFHRDNVPGSVETIYFSYPADVPAYYLAFETTSREAQLEDHLTDRCFLEIVDLLFRRTTDGTDVLEGVSANDEVLTSDFPDVHAAEADRKAEA